jgi:hypothetical protein
MVVAAVVLQVPEMLVMKEVKVQVVLAAVVQA